MSHSKKSVSFPPVLPSTSEGKEVMELKTTHHKEIVTSEMDDTSKALVCSDETPLQCDFIPEEIILSLTNTAYAASCPEALLPRKKVKTDKEMKLGMRPTSNVWHHPCRRDKFRYLTDHPISFTGAGRDVSFLYDVKAEKLADSWLPTLVKEITSAEEPPRMGLSIPDSSPRKLTDTVIPEEFHIASNTGVEGLQYYDDKYTTLLTDSQNRLLLFPSMKPNKRIEVIQLKKVMDTMLEKAGVDAEKSVNATQMHKILEVLKTEQNIYNTVFHEIIRQISVECSDRGELLSNIRQRYVNLLEKIAQQMIDFYKDMVAQRIMDKRIIEELYNFKKVVEELSRELVLVREYDLKLRRKAESIHEELRLALHNAEKNARIVEQYHDLYTSQRIRMETDIKQLTSERDLWNSASYDLAIKVIDRNNITLARRLYLNEKAWNKYVTHFIVLLASQDAKDLSQLQKATHQWRNIFRNFKYELEQNEDYIRGRMNFMKNTLTKMQTVLEKNMVDGELTPIKESVMKTICADFKKCNQILIETSDFYGGDRLVEKIENLRIAQRLQISWTEFAKAIMNRHKSIDGNLPSQGLLDEINDSGSRLYREYELRVNGGENGFNKLFHGLNSTFETWMLKMESDHPATSMYQDDWKILYLKIPELISYVDGMLDIVGYIPMTEDQIKSNYAPVAQANVFHLIQQWILTLSNGTDKDNCGLHHQVNELHISMIKWMVNLLILMVPDYSDEYSLPKTEQDLTEEEIHRHTGIAMLEIEGISLAKMLSRFSIYIFSCCKGTLASMSTKKTTVSYPDPAKEIMNLSKIKKECIDWIATCNILLSKLKGRKVTLLTNEDAKNLGDYELIIDSKTYDVSGWEKTFGEMAQQYLDENFTVREETPRRISHLRIKKETEPRRVSNWWKSTVEMAQRYTDEKKVPEAFRKLSLQEELTALEKFTNNEKERYESLQLIENLKIKLLDTEVRVQQAEEKFEEISEKLTEALAKNRHLQKELEKTNESLKAFMAKETPKDEAEGKDEAKDKDQDQEQDKTKTEDEVEEEEEDKKPGPSEKKVSIRESPSTPSKDKDHHPPSKSLTKPSSRSKR
ncbi:axonemal dynein light chain domain-containing protein 1 isoform X2 [Antechinus flavipes]|uniref:axonemal dynein light chain domain-containing protein 1 isoform X2 n=1 Tax=Antechinus flavipes TaxID=38775 RepID=UPI0022365ECC|nr:axonemal dynein light chain domain-containing protein 1 isoform X2 [Antechinus flavipes]